MSTESSNYLLEFLAYSHCRKKCMDIKICSKNNSKVIKRCSPVVVQLRTSNQDFVYNCILLTSDPYTLLPLLVCAFFRNGCWQRRVCCLFLWPVIITSLCGIIIATSVSKMHGKRHGRRRGGGVCSTYIPSVPLLHIHHGKKTLKVLKQTVFCLSDEMT